MTAAAAGAEGWRPLKVAPPAGLVDAWRQLHWAAQAPAAFAAATVQARSDDSHLSLGWDERHGALVSRPAGGRVRAGLRLADLRLLLIDGDEVREEHDLKGRTLREGLSWLRSAAERAMEAPPKSELVLRGWDMPPHATGSGGRFAADAPEPFEEVARWYSNAALALGELAARTEGASEVRCWPHHFDIATLVSLDPEQSAETARSIGVGMAPPDASIAEPYVYANPWPAPEAPPEASLEGGGEWHQGDWLGAVLRGSRLVEGDVAGQRDRLEAFLRSALEADLALLRG